MVIPPKAPVTKPTAPPAATPHTWLAEAAAWLLDKIHGTQTATVLQSAELQTGRHIVVFGPDRVLSIEADPPARSYTFHNPADFARWIAAHHEEAEAYRPGPTNQPWHPAVYVGLDSATYSADPFGHTVAILKLQTAPAFDLLQRLEAKQEWQDQKAVHELARLDLARVLAPHMADSLAHVAFQVAQTTSRQVGPAGDKGIRQYTQEQSPPADDKRAQLKLGDFEILAPVFVWPESLEVTGTAAVSANIRLDLAAQTDDAAAPRFRLAPIVGQCRLARLSALATLAGLLTTALHTNKPAAAIPVYLAQE